MADYRIATGHNVALEELDPITPEPGSEGVRPARRTYAADGSVHEENLYIELVWDHVASASEYQSLLTQFGLASADVAAVTLYAPGQDYQMQRFNGEAVRPEVGRDVRRRGYFIRDVTILVRQLEVSA